MHRIVKAGAVLIGSAAAAVALALPAGAANVGTHFSNHLAGHLMEGNGTQAFGGIQAEITVPTETSAVPSNSVAQGLALGQNVSTGGEVYGIAAVFDSTAGTCLPGQWTVEAGNALSSPSPSPVPISDLNPLVLFGNDICLNGGQSEFLRIYQSTRHGILDFIAGPNSGNQDVLQTDTGVHFHFLAPAEGITTTNGTAAATLTMGNTFSFGPTSVTLLANHSVGAPAQTIAFGTHGTNYSVFDGTVSGGSPSVANPLTLTAVWVANPGGANSENAVLVP